MNKNQRMNHTKRVIIASPSLDIEKNIGGMSSLVGFVINNNKRCNYSHFEIGKYDKEKRTLLYYFRILKKWIQWFFLMTFGKNLLVHFNIALEKRSIIRDSPLLLYAHLLRKKLIIHIHGGLYLEKEEMPVWIKSILVSILSQKGPKIVLSSVEQRLVISKFHAKSVFVLPNSVDLKEAKDFIRIYSGKSPVRLLFIGRITKTKGIEYIYKALKALKEKDLPFKFIMAGSGEDRDEYVRRFSEVLGSDFIYMGVVSGDIKTTLLKECHVFLLPSLYEGLPISLLECMSFAMVPVVTDVGSIKSVVEDGYNGIVIGKHSYEDISEAIIRLIYEKDLFERLGANAQQSIFEKFDTDAYLKKLNEIYDLA